MRYGLSVATIQSIQNTNGQQKLSAIEIFKNVDNSIVGIVLPNNKDYDKNYHDANVEYDGSGFVYKKDGNTLQIVTNQHVVGKSQKVKVGFGDGSLYPGKVLGTNSKGDIVILQIVWDSTRNQQQPPRALLFGNSSELKIGEQVIAISSSGFGGQTFPNLLTTGVISWLGANITNFEDGTPDIINGIVTDVATAGGSSGGPLFNMRGEIVGITAAGDDKEQC